MKIILATVFSLFSLTTFAVSDPLYDTLLNHSLQENARCSASGGSWGGLSCYGGSSGTSGLVKERIRINNERMVAAENLHGELIIWLSTLQEGHRLISPVIRGSNLPQETNDLAPNFHCLRNSLGVLALYDTAPFVLLDDKQVVWDMLNDGDTMFYRHILAAYFHAGKILGLDIDIERDVDYQLFSDLFSREIPVSVEILKRRISEVPVPQADGSQWISHLLNMMGYFPRPYEQASHPAGRANCSHGPRFLAEMNERTYAHIGKFFYRSFLREPEIFSRDDRVLSIDFDMNMILSSN